MPAEARPVTLFEIAKRAGVDVEIEDAAVSVAGAVILYLAHHRSELDGDPEKLLRLAARAQWQGDPPELIIDWLEQRGVSP